MQENEIDIRLPELVPGFQRLFRGVNETEVDDLHPRPFQPAGHLADIGFQPRFQSIELCPVSLQPDAKQTNFKRNHGRFLAGPRRDANPEGWSRRQSHSDPNHNSAQAVTRLRTCLALSRFFFHPARMPLIQLREVSIAFGGAPVLDQIHLQIDEGERLCLLGRNGSGKTTLMRLLAREEAPNQGEIIQPATTRIARLPQEIPSGLTGPIGDLVRSGLDPDRHEEEWETDRRLEALFAEVGLDEAASFETLSGGLKRRALLARALAIEPSLLLLDEPTNHLDLEAILWLEQFLLTHPLTLFFVTHDRAFLRRLATRILHLDRGQLSSWACDYDTFLARTAAEAEAETVRRASQDKKLAQEEAWLRQGVKARRTRDQGRVAALQKLREAHRQRREKAGRARLTIQEGDLSGQKVIEAENLTFSYPATPPVLDGLTTTIWRGDKIGIMGPNGCGKSTLLKLLLGELPPTSGTVRLGTQLQIVYLDQLRAQIDPAKTLVENVAGSADQVTFQGRSRHVIGYLNDFLFASSQARMPAGLLSGGECHRLLLAKLFLQPANVLVLDEPTNDLDLETLELLEEILASYSGTLLLVSHDRDFLDRVVTSTLVFESPGTVRDYVGGYQDWLRQRVAKPSNDPAEYSTSFRPANGGKKERPRKFLNREQRELEALPAKIEALEARHQTLSEQLVDPAFYQNEPHRLPKIQTELAGIEAETAAAYARWDELESLRQSLVG